MNGWRRLRRSAALAWLRGPYLRFKISRRRKRALRIQQENPRCPLCRSNHVRLIHATVFYGYLECTACLSAWVAELPSDKTLQRFYQTPFLEGRKDFHAAGEWKSWVDFKKQTFQQLEQPLQPYGQSHLLEVGSGEGLLLDLFRGLGWEVTGIERNGSLVEASRNRGHRIWEADIGRLAAGFETFDLVLCFHVLEHLREPLHGLINIASLMTPGGALILETPLSRNWESIDHLYFFSESALERLMKDAGLKITNRFDYHDRLHPEFHNLALRAVRKSPP